MTAIDIDQILSKIESKPKKLLSGRDIAYVLRAFREERAEVESLRAALRQILEDPDATILDSHRDDGWTALAGQAVRTPARPPLISRTQSP